MLNEMFTQYLESVDNVNKIPKKVIQCVGVWSDYNLTIFSSIHFVHLPHHLQALIMKCPHQAKLKWSWKRASSIMKRDLFYFNLRMIEPWLISAILSDNVR
jgi:hypothetical protein